MSRNLFSVARLAQLREPVTMERIAAACEAYHTSLDNPGFCIGCGADADGVEPDARGYECEACGAPLVYGAEELVMLLA